MFQKMNHLPILILLGEMGATHKYVRTSSIKIAELSKVSQQTSSRHIAQLEKLGLISRRDVDKTGQSIILTEEGVKILKETYSILQKALQPETIQVKISGFVITGLGEGAYYMTRTQYVQQFVEKLGFKPWPGTLNLKLHEAEEFENFTKLLSRPSIFVKGFETEERVFGDVNCYPAKIEKQVNGAIILPTRTHHNPKTIEVIAPINLRERFSLQDGMKVTVETNPITETKTISSKRSNKSIKR